MFVSCMWSMLGCLLKDLSSLPQERLKPFALWCGASASCQLWLSRTEVTLNLQEEKTQLAQKQQCKAL